MWPKTKHPESHGASEQQKDVEGYGMVWIKKPADKPTGVPTLKITKQTD